ncbi:hypothetical protein ACP4OV_023061 [Aristida adscensionis]
MSRVPLPQPTSSPTVSNLHQALAAAVDEIYSRHRDLPLPSKWNHHAKTLCAYSFLGSGAVGELRRWRDLSSTAMAARGSRSPVRRPQKAARRRTCSRRAADAWPSSSTKLHAGSISVQYRGGGCGQQLLDGGVDNCREEGLTHGADDGGAIKDGEHEQLKLHIDGEECATSPC